MNDKVFTCILLTEKPRPGGLALAFQEGKPGQSRHEAVKMARPGLAYLGLAWPGSRPQAGPCTALTGTDHGIISRFLGSFFGKNMFGNIIKIVSLFGVLQNFNDGRI